MSIILPHARARTLAVQCHPDAGSALDIFASTGEIKQLEEILNDISQRCQELEIGHMRRKLLALYKYVRNTGLRVAVPNWGTLWDETTSVTIDMC